MSSRNKGFVRAVGLACTTLLLLMDANDALARKKKNDEKKPPAQELRAFFLSSCPVTGEAGGGREFALETLAAILLPKLIDKGIDLTVAAVRKVSGKDDASVTRYAEASGYFYASHQSDDGGPKKIKTTLAPDMGCLVLARAGFGPLKEEEKKADWKKMSEKEDLPEWLEKELVLHRLPSFYLEVKPSLSNDQTAFRLETAYLYSQDPKVSGLAVVYSFATPGGGDNATFATGKLVFEKVPEGEPMAVGQRNTHWMPLLPFGETVQDLIAQQETDAAALTALDLELKEVKGNSELSDEEKENQKSVIARKQLSLQDATNSRIKTLEFHSPVDLTVAVTETRDVNRWLALISETLEESKTELGDALKKELVPGQKEEAEKAELLGALGKQQALQSAILDVRAKQAALDEATEEGMKKSELLVKEKELLLAKMTANTKAVEAGEPLPYPEVL